MTVEIRNTQDLNVILERAQAAAYSAAEQFENKYFPDGGWGACGFAWVDIPVKGNTKLGRMLKAAGVSKHWRSGFQLWNPSKFPTQNIDTLEAGARAAADVLKSAGITAYAGSRLDQSLRKKFTQGERQAEQFAFFLFERNKK